MHSVTFPDFWTKKYKNRGMIEKLSEPALWLDLPDPSTPAGIEWFKKNDLLFQFCETLNMDFYSFEPVPPTDRLELVPENVCSQGLGVSVDHDYNELCVDSYFFPCDYTNDERRQLHTIAAYSTVFSVADFDFLRCFLKEHVEIPYIVSDGNEPDNVRIPFRYDIVVKLDGYFIDHFGKTARKCRAAVENADDKAKLRCETFLSFIKTVGLN